MLRLRLRGRWSLLKNQRIFFAKSQVKVRLIVIQYEILQHVRRDMKAGENYLYVFICCQCYY
jgi:hypothetical protein